MGRLPTYCSTRFPPPPFPQLRLPPPLRPFSANSAYFFDARWEEQAKEMATPPSQEPLLLKMARIGFPGSERLTIFGDRSHLGKTGACDNGAHEKGRQN